MLSEKISRKIILFVLLVGLAACTDLAGDVQIVETLTPIGQSQAQVTTVDDIPLPENPPDIANGERIYAANCTSCHGVNGAGDGVLVENGDVPRMSSFLEAPHMRQQDVSFYYDIITNGNLVNLMPPWAEALSVQDRWDVLMYVYTLHYSEEQVERGSEIGTVSDDLLLDSDATLAQQSELTGEDAFDVVAYQRVQSVRNWGVSAAEAEVTAEPMLEADTVAFSGTLSNGTAGSSIPLPSDVMIQLQYGDFVESSNAVDAMMTADGQFSFENVPVVADSTYFAVAFFDERAFVSERINSEDLETANTVDITMYDVSNAPNMVTMSNLDLVVDYLTVPELGTGIVIGQVNSYDNPTDRVFHLQPEGQNTRVSLLISLPIGAVILEDPNQRSFIPVQEEYSLIDTRPVYPGTHTADTSYFLPYDNEARTVDIRLNNLFEGEVTILVTVPELEIISDVFTLEDTVNVGTEDEPFMAKLYTGTVSYQPGQSVIFDIEGAVSSNTSADSSVVTDEQLVPILLTVAGVTLVLIAGAMFVIRQRSGGKSEVDTIIQDISQLEMLHDAGRINHDAFQQKRTELKARLAELMAEDGN